MSTALLLVSVSTAGLIYLASSVRREAAFARSVLYAFIVGDLLVRAWGICPAFDPIHVAQPDWLAHTRADGDAPFYIGGKRDGTLDPGDADSSKRFLNPPGLHGSESRAALSTQTVYYPSAWQRRELLSYDLAVLWPKTVQYTQERFYTSGPAARSRFLERTGVRYRVLPIRLGEGRTPVVGIPYFEESVLFDWGSGAVAPRVSVVPEREVVASATSQIDAMFEPGLDYRQAVLVDRDAALEGNSGSPVTPAARVVVDRPTEVVVDAGAGEGGGYLVLLDSYSEGWRVTVDDRPATLLRANGLFRAVHIAPGAHTVRFVYVPRALRTGAIVSALGLLVVIGCALPIGARVRTAQREPVHRVAAL
jgi:hypothetical protein